MIDCLDQIENIWLKNSDYLVGNTLSIADIFGACEIEQPSKLISCNMLINLNSSS